MRGGARAGAGRPKLSVEVHKARGTWRRDRHEATATSPPREPDTTDWLDDLPPAAYHVGANMLRHCVVADRDSFRRYLLCYAACHALPRNTPAELDRLTAAQADVIRLLAKTRWR